MKRKQLNLLLFGVQGIGLIFYGIFTAAYMLALPSNRVLSGEPVFHLLLSVFGGLFVLLIIISVMLSIKVKLEE